MSPLTTLRTMQGVTVHHRAQLLSMRAIDGEVEYTIQHHLGGVETIRVERALVAVGRSPNVANLKPELGGVQLSHNGYADVCCVWEGVLCVLCAVYCVLCAVCVCCLLARCACPLLLFMFRF